MDDIIQAKNNIIHYTNIDFTQFKKIKYKNLYLIQINKTNSKTQFHSFHIQYYYTLTFKNKQKNDTISINCQQ